MVDLALPRQLRCLAALAAIACLAALASARAQTPDLDACGRSADHATRIKACSTIIATPGNPPAMVAWAYANRCQAQENARSFDAAIADCSEALRIDPGTAGVYNLRGFAYYAKGDADRALADYDAALRLKPDDAYAHAARGHIYLAKSDTRRRSRNSTRQSRRGPTMPGRWPPAAMPILSPATTITRCRTSKPP